MNDDTFTKFMTDLWGGGDPNADLWEIAMADNDPVFSDPDPRMEARCERSMGDLLADPPFGEATADAEDRQGVWWESAPAALPDRDAIRADHPFPIDFKPGEETF